MRKLAVPLLLLLLALNAWTVPVVSLGIDSGEPPARRPAKSGGPPTGSTLAAVQPEPAAESEPGAPVGSFVSYQELEAKWRAAWAKRAPARVYVRGIYLTGYTAGRRERFEELVRLVDETELNAMVIDVKDDRGKITYRSDLAEVLAAGAVDEKIQDVDRLLRALRRKDIYPIARIVTFKDPAIVRTRPDLAARNTAGEIWRDRTGAAWLDPYNREAWEYNLAIAREAALKGFREIQFDYVRFPSDGSVRTIVYPKNDGRQRADVIADFLAYARKELEPYRVFVSADIFGLITSVSDDQGIGQVLEKLAGGVDYLSPMVYPSHYALGTFGLADPDAAPYQTVFRSLADAVRRLGEDRKLILRPWLQDFSLRNSYGPGEVKSQIRAVEDLGLKEWLLWNPANYYSEDGLRKVSANARPGPLPSDNPAGRNARRSIPAQE